MSATTHGIKSKVQMTADLTASCRVEARAYDAGAYLAALFASPAQRADLWALQAFAGTLARIPALVSEPMLGEIRLQWWREALDGIVAGGAPHHPIAEALALAVTRAKLPLEGLAALIDAQALALHPGGIADEAMLDRYIAPDLLRLSIAVVAPGECGTREMADVIAPAGRALGLAGLFRRLPAQAAARHVPLSTELLGKAWLLASQGLEALEDARQRFAKLRRSQLLPALAR